MNRYLNRYLDLKIALRYIPILSSSGHSGTPFGTSRFLRHRDTQGPPSIQSRLVSESLRDLNCVMKGGPSVHPDSFVTGTLRDLTSILPD